MHRDVLMRWSLNDVSFKNVRFPKYAEVIILQKF